MVMRRNLGADALFEVALCVQKQSKPVIVNRSAPPKRFRIYADSRLYIIGLFGQNLIRVVLLYYRTLFVYEFAVQIFKIYKLINSTS